MFCAVPRTEFKTTDDVRATGTPHARMLPAAITCPPNEHDMPPGVLHAAVVPVLLNINPAVPIPSIVVTPGPDCRGIDPASPPASETALDALAVRVPLTTALTHVNVELRGL